MVVAAAAAAAGRPRGLEHFEEGAGRTAALTAAPELGSRPGEPHSRPEKAVPGCPAGKPLHSPPTAAAAVARQAHSGQIAVGGFDGDGDAKMQLQQLEHY